MAHCLDTHIFRLNSVCRFCAKRSSNRKTKAIECERYLQPIKTHFGIDLKTDNKFKHSSFMCSSCESRLKRCMKGKPLPDGLQSELDFTNTIWSDFDESLSCSECSVCSHFDGLSAGGRPRGGKGNARKRLHASFDRDNENTNIQSSSTTTMVFRDDSLNDSMNMNDALECSSISNTSLDTLNFPLESTPMKKRRIATAFTPPPVPQTMDSSTSPRTPTPVKRTTTEVQTTPVQLRAKTGEPSTNSTPKARKIRSPDKIKFPIFPYEEKLNTAVMKAKLGKSADKTTVGIKTGGKWMYFMRIVKAQKKTPFVCTKTIQRRTNSLLRHRKFLAANSQEDVNALFANELRVAQRKKTLEDIFKRAGIRSSMTMTGKQGAVLRASLGISWTRFRGLRRFLANIGVKQEGEKKVREEQKKAVFADLVVRHRRLTFDNPDTQTTELRDTPIAYIDNLPAFVRQLLEKYKNENMLTSHEFIPDDEIWLKIGGDHGGGSMKLMLQVANVQKPNSKHNTFLICIANAKDTHSNLKKIFEPCLRDIEELKEMTWQGKRVRLFMFGDYDFLLKVFGLSSAASTHPCLFCKASRNQYQRSPLSRVESQGRTHTHLLRNHRQYVRAGSKKTKAKSYYNVINKPLIKLGDNMMQVAPPYLHLLLGIVKKHHTLLEEDCHELDKDLAKALVAEKRDVTNETYTPAFKAYVQKEIDIQRKEEELLVERTAFNWYQSREGESLAHLRDRIRTAYDNADDLIDEIEELREERVSLPLLCGPITSNLDKVLQENKIKLQAYHGRSLVGNHCHKYLKENVTDSICDSVLSLTNRLTNNVSVREKAKNISEKFKILNKAYAAVHSSISHSKPISPEECVSIQTKIDHYMELYRLHTKARITPKQHLLESHCLPFIRQWGVGLGLMGEQGGEESHAFINILKSRIYGIKTEEERLRILMKEHFILISPVLRGQTHDESGQKKM